MAVNLASEALVIVGVTREDSVGPSAETRLARSKAARIAGEPP